jgi:hypothetical protein
VLAGEGICLPPAFEREGCLQGRAFSSRLLSRRKGACREGIFLPAELPIRTPCGCCRAVVVWAFNAALLLAARLLNGFQFSAMHPELAWLDGSRGVVR